jgi:hypothetical protein
MRWIAHILLTIGLLVCSGCDGKASADGGGTGTNAHGRAKIGIPF